MVEARRGGRRAEDMIYGVGSSRSDLPAELRRREDRLAKIRATRAALKKETAKARAARARGTGRRLREAPQTDDARPRSRAEMSKRSRHNATNRPPISTTTIRPPPAVDATYPNTPPKRPMARPSRRHSAISPIRTADIMVRDGAFLQAYNAQIAVDEAHQIIVAAALSNQGPRAWHAPAITGAAIKSVGGTINETGATTWTGVAILAFNDGTAFNSLAGSVFDIQTGRPDGPHRRRAALPVYANARHPQEVNLQHHPRRRRTQQLRHRRPPGRRPHARRRRHHGPRLWGLRLR